LLRLTVTNKRELLLLVGRIAVLRTYVDAAYCYQPSSVVCRSVCHTSEPCKNGCTDRDVIWVENSGGPKDTCVRWGPAVLIDVAMATSFATKIAINWLCVNNSH